MFKITVFDVHEESRLKTILVSFKLHRPFALCGSCARLSKEVRNALLDVVVDYTYALNRLDDNDYQRLSIPESSTEEKFKQLFCSKNAIE